MNRILAVIFSILFSSSTLAAEIIFPNNPRFSLDSYLVYMLSKIPMEQLQVEPNSQTVHVLGEIVLNLSNLPEETQAELMPRLQDALAGERTVSGAKLESSQAEISYQNQSRVYRLLEDDKGSDLKSVLSTENPVLDEVLARIKSPGPLKPMSQCEQMMLGYDFIKGPRSMPK